jgi:hypothetical protein
MPSTGIVTDVVVVPTAVSAGHASRLRSDSAQRTVAIGLPSSPVGRSTVRSRRLSAGSVTEKERLKSLWAPARGSVGAALAPVSPRARAGVGTTTPKADTIASIPTIVRATAH